jgi:hypothetical protein
MSLLFVLGRIAGVFCVLLLVPAAANGVTHRSTDSVALGARFSIQWAVADCPPGSPPTTDCYTAVGQETVRGVGQTRLDFLDAVDRSDPAQQCEKWSLTGSLEAGSKGSLSFVGSSDGCIAWHSALGKNSFSITGGSGKLANTTGSGTLDFVAFAPGPFKGSVVLSGTLSTPNYTFDTTPPVLSGAVNRTIRVSRHARRVRVTYAASAQDAVDGQVPVSCKLRSGSFFKLGRTRVSCSATDSSGNTARGRFVVIVKRRS